ncbi:MAG: DUF1565 domain-containing protein [Leptolyngbyaceae cyanobacterium]
MAANGLPATAESIASVQSATIPQQVRPTSTMLVVDPAASNAATADGSERSPFKTITQALQAAQTDTVLLLKPGSYTQENGEQFPIQLKAGVTLYGNPQTHGQDVVIRGGGTFLSPVAGRQSVALLVTDPSVITGVTITNPDPKGSGVWIESANATMENNTLSNSGQAGLTVVGRATPRIAGNFFTTNGMTGLVVSGTSQADVEGNIFEATGVGILVNQQATPTIRQNRITENTDGLVVQADAKPVLQNNSIEGNQRSQVKMAHAEPGSGSVSEIGSDTAIPPQSQRIVTASLTPVLPSLITFGQRFSPPSETPAPTDQSLPSSMPIPQEAMPTVVVQPTAASRAARQKSLIPGQSSKSPPVEVSAQPSTQPRVMQTNSSEPNSAIIEFDQPLPEAMPLPRPQAAFVAVRPKPVPLPMQPIARPPSLPATAVVARSGSFTPPAVTIPVPAPEASVVRPVPPPSPTRVTVAPNPSTTVNLTTLQLLPVPGPNIPLGNAGNSPEVAVYQGPFRRSDGTNPPTPPMQISSLSLRYRVVVPIEGEETQSQMQSLVPDAFLTSTNGQRVIQLGAFSDRSKADQLVQTLSDQGVRAILEAFK